MKRAFVAGDVNLKYHPESLIKWKYWNSNVQNKNVFKTFFSYSISQFNNWLVNKKRYKDSEQVSVPEKK